MIQRINTLVSVFITKTGLLSFGVKRSKSATVTYALIEGWGGGDMALI